MNKYDCIIAAMGNKLIAVVSYGLILLSLPYVTWPEEKLCFLKLMLVIFFWYPFKL